MFWIFSYHGFFGAKCVHAFHNAICLGFSDRSFVAAELCHIDRSSLMLQKRSVPRKDQLAWDLVLGKRDVCFFFLAWLEIHSLQLLSCYIVYTKFSISLPRVGLIYILVGWTQAQVLRRLRECSASKKSHGHTACFESNSHTYQQMQKIRLPRLLVRGSKKTRWRESKSKRCNCLTCTTGFGLRACCPCRCSKTGWPTQAEASFKARDEPSCPCLILANSASPLMFRSFVLVPQGRTCNIWWSSVHLWCWSLNGT